MTPEQRRWYMMGFMDGSQDALGMVERIQGVPATEPWTVGSMDPQAPPKPKRKVSTYHKRLGREIKALRAKHLLKTGKWRKGWSQKKMMKAAHKAAKKG
ncbi:MAG TPA: hypothetical protein EYO33_19925 [Phycisphaerales bacterium]|nr:hypothetical protein [Phycisphaerales bacterium]